MFGAWLDGELVILLYVLIFVANLVGCDTEIRGGLVSWLAGMGGGGGGGFGGWLDGFGWLGHVFDCWLIGLLVSGMVGQVCGG